MSTLAREYTEHCEIAESAVVGSAGPIRADGLVPIYVIRPGLGRGKGRHVYEARMLEENAHVFKGWKMFVDHQSSEAKKAAGGLPRSIRDLGGIIKESWWDPAVPADPEKGHGPGAVVGLARPTPLIRQLIETDPALVEASVSATATGVRPVQHGGQTAWLVEGFERRGSVDWVSLAGAGGRVAALAEALEESLTEEDMEMELLESMSDAELMEHLRKTRPDLARELAESDAGDGDKGEKKPANKTVEETEEVEDVKTSLEVLTEALETDEGRQLVEGLVAGEVDKVFKQVAAPKLAELVEAALEEERDLIVAEADARANRRVELRDLKDAAHALIEAARLPETFKRELKARYDLTEGEGGEKKPTPGLDVTDERDEKGAEAVEADVKAKQLQHSEIAPTTVRGQGRTATEPTDDEGKGKADKDKEKESEEGAVTSTGSADTDHLFKKAGVEIDESLYDGILS
jgi:hypothetical protein